LLQGRGCELRKDLLAEQDMGIRWAARERVGALLADREPPEQP
jgi:hypothetical protein